MNKHTALVRSCSRVGPTSDVTRHSVNSSGIRGIAFPVAIGLLIVTASALAEPFAYVTNYQSHSVSVIDTATNAVIATVPVGSSPGGVAITPDGAFAYVANQGSTISCR